jgi:hypothetical protein
MFFAVTKTLANCKMKLTLIVKMINITGPQLVNELAV